jgi:hypothetical protein
MGNPNPITNNLPKEELLFCAAIKNLKSNNRYNPMIAKAPMSDSPLTPTGNIDEDENPLEPILKTT